MNSNEMNDFRMNSHLNPPSLAEGKKFEKESPSQRILIEFDPGLGAWNELQRICVECFDNFLTFAIFFQFCLTQKSPLHLISFHSVGIQWTPVNTNPDNVYVML
jgi:hypothetical protein